MPYDSITCPRTSHWGISGTARTADTGREMATAHDVANYILQQRGEMTTWKLQKLLYYAQAWHLVWDDEPLFPEEIQAWANGPVVRPLYQYHRKQFSVSEWERGDPANLTPSEKATVDAVLRSYGDLTGRQLSHLTHSERPWLDARKGLGPTDRSEAVITPNSMYEYYGALDADDQAESVEMLDWEDIDF